MIEFNEMTSRALIDLQIVKLVEALSQREGITNTEALQVFMKSKTYDLLTDSHSYLCLESPPYILDMYDAELSGDWERWLEV